MAMARIQPLGTRVGNSIRAPGILPALHNIVEELVMNSLDSGASSIRVQIDISKFSLEVNDSGHGIHEEALAMNGFLGQWHFSSKTAGGDTSYGFRGEALAAINELSELTIISKISGRKTVARTFGSDSKTKILIGELDSLRNLDSGTVVRACNVFGRFPVRQRMIKGNLEIARVREFIQKMAILHHKCEWVLDVIGNQHPLIHLSSDQSVASRFAKIVSQDILTTMVPVDVCCDGMRLVGLMSPPLPKCCQLRRDYQFFYLGQRWMRGRDFVTALLNTEFKSLLEIVNGKINSCGPQPKHASSHGNHACYVLQLICADPTNEYDLYTEPSKTVPVFREPRRVQQVIRKLLEELLYHCESVDKSILSEIALNLDTNADLKVPHESSIDTGAHSEIFTYKVREGPFLEDGDTSCDTLFRSVFLPSPTAVCSIPETTSLAIKEINERTNSEMVSMDIENEAGDNEHEMLPGQLIPPFEGDNDARSYSQTSLHSFSYANNNKETFANTFLSSPGINTSKASATMNKFTSTESDHHLPAAQHNNMISNSLSRGAFTALNISKDLLRNECLVIGQADKKYLVLRIGKLLVAADQHAVDERIRLEQYASALSKTKANVVVIPPVALAMNAANRAIICERKSLLNSCGFFYDSCEDATGVILQTVPLINGEALVEADFLEFVDLLAKDSVPDSLCKPPAVSRILASHACRQSIKFGDFLTFEQCQRLMLKLSVVELPFICAHGRVSMVPLMNLDTLAASAESFSSKNNRGAFQSKHKKRPKPNYNMLFN